MNLSLSSIKHFIAHIIQRFHLIIFVLSVTSGLMATILILNGIVISSSQQVTPGDTSLNSIFDQPTIDRIEKLRTRNDKATQLDLSNGRANPFVE